MILTICLSLLSPFSPPVTSQMEHPSEGGVAPQVSARHFVIALDAISPSVSVADQIMYEEIDTRGVRASNAAGAPQDSST